MPESYEANEITISINECDNCLGCDCSVDFELFAEKLPVTLCVHCLEKALELIKQEIKMCDNESGVLGFQEAVRKPKFVRSITYQCKNAISDRAYSGNFCMGFTYTFDLSNPNLSKVINVPINTNFYWERDYDESYICPDCMEKAIKVIKEKKSEYEDFLKRSNINLEK